MCREGSALDRVEGVYKEEKEHKDELAGEVVEKDETVKQQVQDPGTRVQVQIQLGQAWSWRGCKRSKNIWFPAILQAEWMSIITRSSQHSQSSRTRKKCFQVKE